MKWRMATGFLMWTLVFSSVFSRAQDPAQNENPTGPGYFEFELKAYKGLEGNEVAVKVTRNDGTSGAVSVDFETVDGSARSGRDYEPVRQTVGFADGDEKAKTVIVRLNTDLAPELPERLKLKLSNPTGGASLGESAEVSLTIVMISNDAVVLGLLATLLALVFITAHSERPGFQKFYKYVPSLLLCYFLPSLLSTFGIISGDHSRLYFVASRYLLPSCLVLLCLSIDLKAIWGLGPKALIMFFTGTLGIVLGGPLAILIFSAIDPDIVGGEGPNAVWRGLSTVAGSWIGGGANQAAMKEIFGAGDRIFSAMIAVDVIVANLWMAVLLYMAGESDAFDKKLKADNSAIKELQKKITDYQAQIATIPTLTDLMKLSGIGFALTAAAHFCADFIAPGLESLESDVLEWLGITSKFFWLIALATAGGLVLSFTRARKMEGIGASKVGSAFLYILVATIGMKMDLMAIFHYPSMFLVGIVWIGFHAVLLLVTAKLIRAPVFFLAVGSQANVGGAASAPIVASAFHPSLATVGVLLAVFGYFLGTYAAWGCGLLMRWLAP